MPKKLPLRRRDYAVVLLLTVNALLKALKFGEAYLTPYLTDVKGLTKEQVYDYVLPVWTYSYLLCIFPVSFCPQWLGGFRGLIWISSIMDALTYGLFAWGEGLFAMQCAEASFGFTTATSTGFFAALTELLPKESRSFGNALMRSTLLIGHLLGSLGAHIFLKWGLPMQYLYIISFVCLVVAFSLTLLLPKRREFEEVPDSEISSLEDKMSVEPCSVNEPSFWRTLIKLFRTCYSSIDMIVVGNASSFMYAGFTLAETNIPSVWFEFGKQDDAYLNGIMDTIGKTVAALTVFAVGFLPVSMSISAQVFILTSLSLLAGCHYFISSALFSASIILAAIAYVAMMSLGYGLIAYFTGIAAIAFSNTREYALFMGVQCIVSLSTQSIIVAVMANSKEFISLSHRYMIFMGILMIAIFLIALNIFRKQTFIRLCK